MAFYCTTAQVFDMTQVAGLMNRSKSALARALTRETSAADKRVVRYDRILDLANETIGLATGSLAAAGVGFVETRYPNKDGTRLSLGPIALPTIAGGVLHALSYIPAIPDRPQTHMRMMAAAQYGLSSGTVGRGAGAISKVKSDAKKVASGTVGSEIVGAEHPTALGWSEDERALLEV